MKRHPALAGLSRDHHHALVVARKLRRADDATLATAVHAFLDHWRAEERRHFRLEEEVLLPAFAAHGDPEHPVVARVLVDHVVIRRDARLLQRAPVLPAARALGERLAAHVHLEERELFERIERTMPESALAQLGLALERGDLEGADRARM
jgi:iron-sulfur cluster repair protein YtfE (RIC family)